MLSLPFAKLHLEHSLNITRDLCKRRAVPESHRPQQAANLPTARPPSPPSAAPPSSLASIVKTKAGPFSNNDYTSDADALIMDFLASHLKFAKLPNSPFREHLPQNSPLASATPISPLVSVEVAKKTEESANDEDEGFELKDKAQPNPWLRNTDPLDDEQEATEIDRPSPKTYLSDGIITEVNTSVLRTIFQPKLIPISYTAFLFEARSEAPEADQLRRQPVQRGVDCGERRRTGQLQRRRRKEANR